MAHRRSINPLLRSDLAHRLASLAGLYDTAVSLAFECISSFSGQFTRPALGACEQPPHCCQVMLLTEMRLRSRAAEEAARDAADRGERLLHFPAPQRVDANRTTRRDA